MTESTERPYGHRNPPDSSIWMIGALFPVLFAAGIVAVTTAGWFFDISIGPWTAPLGLLVATVIMVVIPEHSVPLRRRVLSLMIGFLLVGFGVWGARSLYDVTWDGQGYHQSAVLALSDGWNPFTEYRDTSTDRLLKYANWYPKGPWIVAAATYQATGRIETGKWMAITLPASLLLFLLAFLFRTHLNRLAAVALSLVTVLNPVSTCQWFSFLVDGQLAVLLVLTTLTGFLHFRHPDRLVSTAFAATLVYTLNVKFNGLVYGMMAVLLAWGMACFSNRKRPLSVGALRWPVWAMMTAVYMVGFNPYVTNTITRGHPLYPIAGPHRIDVLKWQRPADFVTKGRFPRFVLSLFGRPSNAQVLHLTRSETKNPFTVSLDEFRPFVQSSLRVAGFGPLFAAGVVLAVLLLLSLVITRSTGPPQLLLAVLVVLVSVLINPDSWWARLVPQFWMFPVLISAIAPAGRYRWQRVAGTLVLILLLLNAGGIAASYTVQYVRVNHRLKVQLDRLRKSPQVVYTGLFRSVRIRLKEAGIRFREVPAKDNLPSPAPERLTWSTALICRDTDPTFIAPH